MCVMLALSPLRHFKKDKVRWQRSPGFFIKHRSSIMAVNILTKLFKTIQSPRHCIPLFVTFTFLLILNWLVMRFVTRSGMPLSYNRGIAFGIGASMPSALIAAVGLLFFITCVFLITTSSCRPSGLTLLGVGSLLAGTAGNLFERIRFGYITDWICLPYTDAFFSRGLWINLPDIYLCAGGAVVLWRLWSDGEFERR